MPKFSFYIIVLLLILGCAISNHALAQSPSPHAPWIGGNNNALPNIDESANATKNTYAPDKIAETKPPSILEEMYSNRIIDAPKQFGYEIFNNNTHPNMYSNAPMGAVQDDFVLGVGDTLQITFSGQRTDQDSYIIDSRGMLIIQDMPPIPAMGRTISQIRRAVDNALSISHHNTNAYIALSSVRQIGVLVVGNVKHPGRKTLNAFHSVLDALNQSGGVQKDGSLRRIKLVRNGRSTIIDLYALLMHGAAHVDMRLRDGDRLIIPPIGPSVAISGAVKRPGIYEIKTHMHSPNNSRINSSEMLSLNEMLGFSGGVISPGKNRFIKLGSGIDGQENIEQIEDEFAPNFSDGTILSVVRGESKKYGSIELIGHTRTPGLHDLSRNKTLSSLLENENVAGADIYPLIGVIKRWDSEQFAHKFLSFPVRLVFKGDFDLLIQDGDVIRLLSNRDISDIYNKNINDTLSQTNTEQGSRDSEDSILDDPPLISYLKERSVSVRGAVRRPGKYPVSQGATLDNLLAVAGGITLEANTQNIEVTSKNFGISNQDHERSGTQRTTIDFSKANPQNISISAGDAVRVNQKFRKTDDSSVLIVGEIFHPGHYDLLAGDTVASLIKRAGGLSAQAYPPGSIFSRESERRAEEIRFRAAAQDMKQSLAAAVQREDKRPNDAQIALVRSLADDLDNIEAVGRITVETDPAILTIKPELDMLLEKGDRIYIPKRPLTVRVSGEILSPASLQFRKDKKPLDYINQAGGFTYHADKDRSFVLYPNGSAQPLQVSAWNHNPIFIPPGSTIIVPRDPKPFDFIESAKDISQILSNLAVTGIFIDDIRD